MFPNIRAKHSFTTNHSEFLNLTEYGKQYLNEKIETLGRETLSKNSTVKTNIRKPALHIKNAKR